MNNTRSGKQKNKKGLSTVLLFLLGFLFVHIPVYAQAILTPTADFDGNIYYVAEANDTCLSISLKMGIDMDTLKKLNNLNDDCSNLMADTKILLGVYHTPTPTAGPSPTPTPIVPTATPFNGYAQVCVALFEDVNGDGTFQEIETGIGGGAVSITKKNGSENFNGLTTGLTALCFDQVPEGDYNISVAPPNEYNATTNMNYAIQVKAGDTIRVNFGAQKQAAFEDPALINKQSGNKRSPMMALLGALFMIVGGGLVIVFGILKRKE